MLTRIAFAVSITEIEIRYYFQTKIELEMRNYFQNL